MIINPFCCCVLRMTLLPLRHVFVSEMGSFLFCHHCCLWCCWIKRVMDLNWWGIERGAAVWVVVLIWFGLAHRQPGTGRVGRDGNYYAGQMLAWILQFIFACTVLHLATCSVRQHQRLQLSTAVCCLILFGSACVQHTLIIKSSGTSTVDGGANIYGNVWMYVWRRQNWSATDAWLKRGLRRTDGWRKKNRSVTHEKLTFHVDLGTFSTWNDGSQSVMSKLQISHVQVTDQSWVSNGSVMRQLRISFGNVKRMFQQCHKCWCHCTHQLVLHRFSCCCCWKGLLRVWCRACSKQSRDVRTMHTGQWHPLKAFSLSYILQHCAAWTSDLWCCWVERGRNRAVQWLSRHASWPLHRFWIERRKCAHHFCLAAMARSKKRQFSQL